MPKTAQIGLKIQIELNLTDEDIIWLVTMARAVSRAFTWTEGQPIRTLTTTLDVSPTTFYTKLRLVVVAMMCVRRGEGIRDLQTSRDKWKSEALAARKKIKDLENKLSGSHRRKYSAYKSGQELEIEIQGNVSSIEQLAKAKY